MKCYDEHGRAISIEDWAAHWQEGFHFKSRLPSGVEVSTRYIGIDLNPYAQRPQIYETIVFGPAGTSLELKRYTDEIKARAGHDRLVVKYS